MRRIREIQPPEAQATAAQFRALSSQARELAFSWYRLTQGLAQDWEGEAHIRFEEMASSGKIAAEDDVLWSEWQAGHVASIRVRIWETDWKPELSPKPGRPN